MNTRFGNRNSDIKSISSTIIVIERKIINEYNKTEETEKYHVEYLWKYRIRVIFIDLKILSTHNTVVVFDNGSILKEAEP